MDDEIEVTGPPIGEPPLHVHEEPQVENLEDDVDELLLEIRSLETVSSIRHIELLERINTCQTQLQTLSNQENQQTESPLLSQLAIQLTQIQSELSEVKAELTTLKESTAMKQPNREPNELTIPPVEELVVESNSPNQEGPIDVESGVENEPAPKPKPRRWV